MQLLFWKCLTWVKSFTLLNFYSPSISKNNISIFSCESGDKVYLVWAGKTRCYSLLSQSVRTKWCMLWYRLSTRRLLCPEAKFLFMILGKNIWLLRDNMESTSDLNLKKYVFQFCQNPLSAEYTSKGQNYTVDTFWSTLWLYSGSVVPSLTLVCWKCDPIPIPEGEPGEGTGEVLGEGWRFPVISIMSWPMSFSSSSGKGRSNMSSVEETQRKWCQYSQTIDTTCIYVDA